MTDTTRAQLPDPVPAYCCGDRLHPCKECGADPRRTPPMDPFKHADRPPGGMLRRRTTPSTLPVLPALFTTPLRPGQPTRREVLVVYLDDGEATLETPDGQCVTLDADTTRALFRHIDHLAENA